MKKKKSENVASAVQKEEPDAMDAINDLELAVFAERFVMEGSAWKSWKHPTTSSEYTLNIEIAAYLSTATADFESCFRLIEFTSSQDYKLSKDGWKPRAKKNEMKLLDLKYLLVRDLQGEIKGFCSFMPTYEDGYAVIYCYEIHLGPELQGSGLGKILMSYLEVIGSKIPEVSKIMLTVFLSNKRGIKFYSQLGYKKDEFSPAPKILRNGTKVEVDYAIFSKSIQRQGSKRKRED